MYLGWYDMRSVLVDLSGAETGMPISLGLHGSLRRQNMSSPDNQYEVQACFFVH